MTSALIPPPTNNFTIDTEIAVFIGLVFLLPLLCVYFFFKLKKLVFKLFVLSIFCLILFTQLVLRCDVTNQYMSPEEIAKDPNDTITRSCLRELYLSIGRNF